ncbi:cupin domain-containing protein [Rhodopseudomonas palustris]|uniref:Cupin 2, conserved barrel n=1 Tax=Rhodopseudomonas palustris (strain BisB18) TaxID=316056 RepID=Q20ZM7_RHOPB
MSNTGSAETRFGDIAQRSCIADPGAISTFIDLLPVMSSTLEGRAKRVLTKPYGRNIIVVLGPTFGISLVQMLPGRSTSLHFHRVRREMFLVRRGTLSFFHGDVAIILDRDGMASSTPGEPHRLANDGTEELEFLELFAPGDIDDKVRIDDRYGRPLGQVSHRE